MSFSESALMDLAGHDLPTWQRAGAIIGLPHPDFRDYLTFTSCLVDTEPS